MNSSIPIVIIPQRNPQVLNWILGNMQAGYEYSEILRQPGRRPNTPNVVIANDDL